MNWKYFHTAEIYYNSLIAFVATFPQQKAKQVMHIATKNTYVRYELKILLYT